MSETKHTPGDWKAGERDSGVTFIFDDDDKALHQVGGRTLEQIEANAKLIAAAPEMLEVCKEALRMYEKVLPAGGWQHVHDGLMSVIKKATT